MDISLVLSWPVMMEDFGCWSVVFRLEDDVHASALGCYVEAAYAGEEGTNG